MTAPTGSAVPRATRATLIIVGVVAVAGLGVGIYAVTTSDPSKSSSGSLPATTTAPSTASTTSTPTTTQPATTSISCTASGDTLPKGSADPMAMSALFGKNITLTPGANQAPASCVDRIVIELQAPENPPGPTTFPGWTVGYRDDPQPLDPSGETANLLGTATLAVRVGSWMQMMDGTGYQGSSDIFPTNSTVVKEMRLLENFEGVMQWGIGLDVKRAFTVTTLTNPARLVIDIQTGS